MPSKLDCNANTHARHNRNWKRLCDGAATVTLSVGGGIEFNGSGGIQTSAFTGDVTKAAGGTVLTLATVNANIGTFNNVTVNAKGLVTAASNVAYLTGNQTITLSGAVTGSGATAIVTTLANSIVGLGNLNSLTTKGDLLTHTGAAHVRQGVGTNGFILVADSGVTNGLKWIGAADTSLSLSVSGPAVALATNPGLEVSSGLKIRLHSSSGLQLTATGLAALFADSTLAQSPSGMAVNFPATGGLEVSSGLRVKLVSAGGIERDATGIYIPLNGGTLASPVFGGLQYTGNSVSVRTRTNGGLGEQVGSGSSDKGIYVLGFNNVTSDETTNGFVWFHTTDQSHRVYQSGAVKALAGRMFTNNAESSAIASTSSLTNFDQNWTMPANFLTDGRRMRIRCGGRYSTTGTPTLNILIRYGTTTILQTGATTTGSGVSNLAWWLEAEVECRSTGASGTQTANGFGGIAAGSLDPLRGGNPTVDTTGTLLVTASAQWSAPSASNTITLENISIEALN